MMRVHMQTPVSEPSGCSPSTWLVNGGGQGKVRGHDIKLKEMVHLAITTITVGSRASRTEHTDGC